MGRKIVVESFTIDTDEHYQCFGGQPFYPFDPMRSLNCITIETIAHVLARTPRFRSRTRRFYSVAEHSLNVSALLPSELEIAGLLHDAHEAFSPFGDVCGPFKPPFIEDMEGEIDVAIAAKFELDVESFWNPEVAQADRFMLAQERWHLLDDSQPTVSWGECDNIPRKEEYESLAIPRPATEVREAYEHKLRTLLVRRKREKAKSIRSR